MKCVWVGTPVRYGEKCTRQFSEADLSACPGGAVSVSARQELTVQLFLIITEEGKGKQFLILSKLEGHPRRCNRENRRHPLPPRPHSHYTRRSHDFVVLARPGSASTRTVVSSMLTREPERISPIIRSINGRQALAAIYMRIETAKDNGLGPYR